MDENSKSPAIGWQLFQSVTTVGAVIFIVTSLPELADYFVRKDSVLRTRLAKMDFNDGSLSFEAWFSMKKHTMAIIGALLLVVLASNLYYRLRSTRHPI